MQWRVAGWWIEESTIRLEFSDGDILWYQVPESWEDGTPDEDSAFVESSDDWLTRMWQEATDDCAAAGLEFDGDDCFIKSAGYPTRWHDMDELPAWAKKLVRGENDD